MATKKKFENTLKVMQFCLLFSGIKTKYFVLNYILDVFVNTFLTYVNMVTLYSVVLGEIILIVRGIQMDRDFVELSLALPLITVSFLGTVKSFNLFLNKSILCEVIDTLTDIHPEEKPSSTSKEFQQPENMQNEEDRITNESVTFLNTMINLMLLVSCSVLIMFCLAPLFLMGFDYFTKGETSLLYAYEVEYWFDVHDIRWWPFLYLHQVFSSKYVNTHKIEIM